MTHAKALAAWTLRRSLAIGTGHAAGIRILAGPMRGKRLPRHLALKNLAILLGQYESAVVKELLALTKEGDVAYDIGGHIGFMSLILASRVGEQGKVFVFEPVPENLAGLKSVVLLNKLEQVVTIVPKAVSNTTCEGTMFLHQSSSMHLLQETGKQSNSISGAEINVRTTALDFFLLHEEHPIPNLLKIDVEGAETSVIEGAVGMLRRDSPTLVVEIHGPDNARNLWDMLRDLGYMWWYISPKGRIPMTRKDDCVAPFSSKSWTHHFLMQRK